MDIVVHEKLHIDEVLDIISYGGLGPKDVTFLGNQIPPTQPRRAKKRNFFSSYPDDQLYLVTISDGGDTALVSLAD